MSKNNFDIQLKELLNETDIVLDDEQKKAVELAFNKKSFFLTGKAGTGKSTVTNIIIKILTKKYGNEKKIAKTASTGLAASNINGITLHSFSSIGVNKGFDKIIEELYYEQNEYRLNRWLYTKILIIDEISMINKDTFELVDQVAKYIFNNDKPFGGLQVIIVGDFSQLPPVEGKFCFESEIWDEMFNKNKIFLTKIHRQTDEFYIDGLNKIRLGCKPNKEFLNFIDKANIRNENKFDIYPTKYSQQIKKLQNVTKKN
jgi:ATP-dependent DNA helicase PIF1